MKRFLMTIPEAAQLVLEAAALPEAAGRIAVLEMGTQVRILELAEQLIRLSGLVPYHDVQIVFTGLRPGEKLEEELVAPNETLAQTSVDKIRVVAGNGGGGATLARQIRSLIAVTGEGDERSMVRALTAIVTEYQPERLELVGTAAGTRRNGNGTSLRRHSNGNGSSRRRGISRRNGTGDDLAAPPVTAPPEAAGLTPETTPRPPTGTALSGGGAS
jgi:hypothetical protein